MVLGLVVTVYGLLQKYYLLLYLHKVHLNAFLFTSRSRYKVFGNENEYLFNQKPHCSNLEEFQEKWKHIVRTGHTRTVFLM